jgi:acetyltransferase
MVRLIMTVPRLNPTGRFNPDSLFRPASVAVIGAETEAGVRMLANIALGGFKGTVQQAATVADLQARPDLAIIATAADQAEPAMAALAAKGCFAAVVPGPADDLAGAASRTGVRALGPHSFGVAAPGNGFNATLSHIPPPAGRLALVSQSGALARTVIDWSEPNGVGFSHIIGIGGNADIGFGMALDWLSRNTGTCAILLDIRRLKNGRAFLSAAHAAARLRPVVALRAGNRLLDPDGAAAMAFEAALRRAGVLTVARLDDLLSAAETLSRSRPPRSERLAVAGNALGPARVAADAVVAHGLTLEPPEQAAMSRPLARQIARYAERPDVGAVLAVHTPTGPADAGEIAALTGVAHTLKVPLLVCAMGETTGAAHRRQLASAGLPVFATPDQAVRGFMHLVRDRRNRAAARELPPRTILPVAPDRADVAQCFASVRRTERLGLLQDEALRVLAAYGIPVVPARAVATAEDAASAASLLGLPVAVKLRQPIRPCTRPADGLALDLHTPADVSAAARVLLSRATRLREDVYGLLVQRQAGRAWELAVRMSDDPTFGPVIEFGAGGTMARSPRDTAMDLPPLNLPLAHALIGRSRIGAQLGQALRDRPPADSGAVAEALVRVSQLVVDFPEIAELDIGALFADSCGVMVADAWIRLRPGNAPPARMAIAPYPAELITRHELGEPITIRPIRPEDAEAHAALFRRLSPQDIRFRFFSAMRELPREQLVRLTQIDYDREMAFIAVRDATGETAGVARLVCDTQGVSGEFAVIVQPDIKGRGLASLLMRRLIDWGRGRGLSEIVGQVLADNTPMLGFVRHLGFSVHRMPDETDVMEVRLPLA